MLYREGNNHLIVTLSFLLVRNSNRIQSSIIGSIGITHSKERVVSRILGQSLRGRGIYEVRAAHKRHPDYFTP